MKLNTTEEIIEDIRQGKMVIIMDDEDRENEGDLLMAASAVTPDAVNYMARYGVDWFVLLWLSNVVSNYVCP